MQRYSLWTAAFPWGTGGKVGHEALLYSYALKQTAQMIEPLDAVVLGFSIS